LAVQLGGWFAEAAKGDFGQAWPLRHNLGDSGDGYGGRAVRRKAVDAGGDGRKSHTRQTMLGGELQ
jgi:hypothetical protein